MLDNRIYFRPSVIIFVDETGEHIRGQLDPLLAFLDTPLRRCVGLIQYPIGPDEARAWFASDLDEDQATTGSLGAVARRILHNVHLNEHVQDIQDAGYWMANTRPQVFIVGHADSVYISEVLQVVRKQVRNLGLATEVCYVLSRWRGNITGALPLLDDVPTPAINWAEREVPDFCYLYEDIMLHPVSNTVTLKQSHYAAAEAIFSLIATGITSQFAFAQQVHNSAQLNGYEQVGTLSTSMVIFPRPEVQRYCSAQLANDLLDQWREDIRQSRNSDRERERRREQARAAIAELQKWLEDSQIRPGTELIFERRKPDPSKDDQPRVTARPTRWPNLLVGLRGVNSLPDSDRQDVLSIYQRLENESRKIFRIFEYKSVNDEYRHHRHTARTWAEIAYRRAGTALSTFQSWDGVATPAWKIASDRTSKGIKYTIDQIWPINQNGLNGLELAQVFIDEYDDKSAELFHLLSVWRRAHSDTYEDTLSQYERIAEGVWSVQPGQSQISGHGNRNSGGQAGPTGRINGANQGANGSQSLPNNNAAGGILGLAPTEASQYQHLSDREESIAENLGRRVTWEQSRVPSRLNLAAAGVMVVPLLMLTILSLFPSLALTPLLLLGIFAGIITAIGLGSWGFYRFHQRNMIWAQKELLRFYCCVYAHRCEQREDHLRRLVMGPLRRRVQAMRERLDDMNSFINALRTNLNKIATDTHDELFSSPAADRDVFVGNGTRLQKKGPFAKNTLDDFAKQILRERLKNKIPEHHPAILKNQLLASFQGYSQSIIEMNDQEAEKYIYDFAESVVTQYIKEGPLVNIDAALEAEETWDYVFSRIRAVYRARVGMQEPELAFICGRRADLERGKKYIKNKQREAILVNTDTVDKLDWLLVAGFFRDRAPSPGALDSERLFPKKQPSGAPNSPGVV
jgi:hypothetical protein